MSRTKQLHNSYFYLWSASKIGFSSRTLKKITESLIFDMLKTAILAKSLDIAIFLAHKQLDRLVKFYEGWSLTTSLTKTQAVVYTIQRYSTPRSFIIHDYSLWQHRNVLWPYVAFPTHLYGKHVSSIISRANTKITAFYGLFKSNLSSIHKTRTRKACLGPIKAERHNALGWNLEP